MRLPVRLAICAVTGCLMVLPVYADHSRDEHRLLQSWGFQSADSGKLVFKNNDKPQSVYQPWTPDLTEVKLQLPQERVEPALPPLVVSAKKKSAE